MKKGIIVLLLVVCVCVFTFGCMNRSRFRGDYPFKESDWIRDGDPLMFENTHWHPTDDVENLLDREVEYVGEFRGIPFYIEKRDVRPFERLYTKFGYHQFRVFKKREK
ncbi:hypothetical protein ACFL38_00445 [Candidatus Omnitrophota bacterium]